MTHKEKLANGDEIWRDDRGHVRSSVRADSVVLIIGNGHPTPGLIPLFLSDVERRIQRGVRVHWFGDYANVTSYDTEVRIALTDFLQKHKDHCESVTVLTRHRLIAMAVAVANMAVGGTMTVTADREKFERMLATAVTRAKAATAPAMR